MVGPSYPQQDLLLLIGQCTVELAYLRARVAELEQQLAQLNDPPDNGKVLESLGGRAPIGESR